ncbi:hypothetical protein PHYBLDRAFT_143916 [Phycomyces blakesleeanus NRRL 1555(-)]|uniref:DDE Tnp4 domain-containing protein n=1 Tax=Phycomyces blakesleeanus (strain ATCC 8743b / DSM 1359 / FGSC 10004 / NBRC 33097 / NRRL 1555) TaxID=763407 RepID=A0A167NCJ5_PHYB8|nr:hypothetical protein PHYBLDRAFT_143916 [Phycomyces blakesleeanus NRRL 1555(-)]OAD75668.1 hypothetical protein PHYBLDRAFT_143916 [Phycomyces blakesleeanus NRRL 1555(-)]|eukprot:XP_018293708.1 hypothetical protein PHYBLDRAFT_143916 [Phycomyces blakesleeanus NRRL 1555(-)]
MPRISDRKSILTSLKKRIYTNLVQHVVCDDLLMQNIVENISELFIFQLVSEQRYLSPRLDIPRAPSQMMMTLGRLGKYGTGASVGYVARSFGVSDENERVLISQRIEEQTDFPSCIGFVDGTLIRLEYKPNWDGKDFYNRKSIYCLSAMTVCDDKKRVHHCFTGWPGCSHNARVYVSSQLALSPEAHFSNDQYLLGDSAYIPSMEVVPGFESLKGLHTSVYNKYDIEKIGYWIRCCYVLHNLLLDCGDDTFVEDSVRNTDTPRNDERLEPRTSSQLDKNKRERIKQIIIQ